MHASWDLIHHFYGNSIWPFMPTSSFGCMIFDALIAIWFLTGAPSVLALVSRSIEWTAPGDAKPTCARSGPRLGGLFEGLERGVCLHENPNSDDTWVLRSPSEPKLSGRGAIYRSRRSLKSSPNSFRHDCRLARRRDGRLLAAPDLRALRTMAEHSRFSWPCRVTTRSRHADLRNAPAVYDGVMGALRLAIIAACTYGGQRELAGRLPRNDSGAGTHEFEAANAIHQSVGCSNDRSVRTRFAEWGRRSLSAFERGGTRLVEAVIYAVASVFGQPLRQSRICCVRVPVSLAAKRIRVRIGVGVWISPVGKCDRVRARVNWR